MAFLSDTNPETIQPENRTPPKTENMGALTPISELRPTTRPRAAPEPYRPASADRLALRPDRLILNRIRHFCIDNDISLTHFFEISALDYLKKHEIEYGRPGAKAPQIDKLIKKDNKDLSSIARIYQFWTAGFNQHSQHHRDPWKPTWTDRDKTLEAELVDVDLRHIEAGIITATGNKQKGGQRIVSLRYYAAQIRATAAEMAAMSDQLQTRYLHHLRATGAKHLGIDPPAETIKWLRIGGQPPE